MLNLVFSCSSNLKSLYQLYLAGKVQDENLRGWELLLRPAVTCLYKRLPHTTLRNVDLYVKNKYVTITL